MRLASDDPAQFIRDHTRVASPPFIPELRLHLADDAVALWEMTEAELGAIGLPPPFWAFAWAGGQALARHVLDQPLCVRGRSVLDVASGCGLVAIAAMRAGAARATAVDIDPMAAEAARLNAALNGVHIDAVAKDLIGRPVDADIILVGDLFYDRDLAPPLLAWLQGLAAADKQVLIGDPGRAYLPAQALQTVAHYTIPTPRALEDADTKLTTVWRIISPS